MLFRAEVESPADISEFVTLWLIARSAALIPNWEPVPDCPCAAVPNWVAAPDWPFESGSTVAVDPGWAAGD